MSHSKGHNGALQKRLYFSGITVKNICRLTTTNPVKAQSFIFNIWMVHSLVALRRVKKQKNMADNHRGLHKANQQIDTNQIYPRKDADKANYGATKERTVKGRERMSRVTAMARLHYVASYTCTPSVCVCVTVSTCPCVRAS